MSDILLQEGQKLTEHWTVEFTGKSRIHKPTEEWVECRIVKMYHSTIYGGANGLGRNVDEARLEAVLGLARAIVDDETAFDHDADEIFKAVQLRWFQDTIKEQTEELEALEDEYEPGSTKPDRQRKKIQRRINLLEELLAIWQEDHDYWPEEETEATSRSVIEARAAQIREHTSRRRAASARLAARAAKARADTSQPAGSADRVLECDH